jgi:acetyl-CoA acetyltransferase
MKHVYDGFSPMVWMWIEAFGFAPPGEAHAWAQPETIGRDGPHPLNTSGGNLGSGRIHGFGHVMETAMQMMGTAGVRQIKNAEVALCETGPFGSASSFTCTKE